MRVSAKQFCIKIFPDAKCVKTDIGDYCVSVKGLNLVRNKTIESCWKSFKEYVIGDNKELQMPYLRLSKTIKNKSVITIYNKTFKKDVEVILTINPDHIIIRIAPFDYNGKTLRLFNNKMVILDELPIIDILYICEEESNEDVLVFYFD